MQAASLIFPATMTPILLCDDDLMFCEGLRDFLRPEFDLHMAHSVQEFGELMSSVPYQMVLLDLCLKDGSHGMQLLQMMQKQDLPFIIVSNTATGELLRAARLAKVRGYVNKSCESRQQVVQAMRQALAGGDAYFSNPHVSLSEQWFEKVKDLKPIEKSLLMGIMSNAASSYKNLAQEIGCSEVWAKSNMIRLYRHFNVIDKYGLVRALQKMGAMPGCTPQALERLP